MIQKIRNTNLKLKKIKIQYNRNASLYLPRKSHVIRCRSLLRVTG